MQATPLDPAAARVPGSPFTAGRPPHGGWRRRGGRLLCRRCGTGVSSGSARCRSAVRGARTRLTSRWRAASGKSGCVCAFSQAAQACGCPAGYARARRASSPATRASRPGPAVAWCGLPGRASVPRGLRGPGAIPGSYSSSCGWWRRRRHRPLLGQWWPRCYGSWVT